MKSRNMARGKGRIMCGAEGLGLEELGWSERCLPSSIHLCTLWVPHLCTCTNLSGARRKLPLLPKAVVQVSEGFIFLCGLSPDAFLPQTPTPTLGFHPHLRASLEARGSREHP